MAGAVDGLRPSGARLSAQRAVSTAGPRPLVLAATLTATALLLHVLLWGLQAPLGNAPAGGAAVALAGLAWAAWAAGHLRRGRPRRLLDEGPFRFGRNPMYLGIAVTMAGAGAALGAPLLVLAAAGHLGAMQRLVVPHEEAALRRAFGGWYSDYCASVRRWL